MIIHMNPYIIYMAFFTSLDIPIFAAMSGIAMSNSKLMIVRQGILLFILFYLIFFDQHTFSFVFDKLTTL